MSLPWIKVHTSLLDNGAYKRFSSEAKLTYHTLLMLAGKQDQGDYSGRIEVPNMGPIKVAEIAAYTGLEMASQKAALRALLVAGFISRDLTGTFVVERFKEKAAPLSASSTTRTRAWRERSRDGAGTSPERHCDGAEAEAEADSRIPGKPEKSEREVGAYLILDAVYPVVTSQHPDLGMTKRSWRDRNKSAALDLVDAGKSPDDVAARLRQAYASKFYSGIVMLSKLSEHWAAISAPSKRPQSEIPYV